MDYAGLSVCTYYAHAHVHKSTCLAGYSLRSNLRYNGIEIPHSWQRLSLDLDKLSFFFYLLCYSCILKLFTYHAFFLPIIPNFDRMKQPLSLIHISEPTRRYAISYAVFCLKKRIIKKTKTKKKI